MEELKNDLFVNKYKPPFIENILLPKRIKSNLLKGVSNHLLFHGPPGCGKTTSAILLCEENGHDYLKINASKDNGIETIRNKISKFCSNRSLNNSNNFKVVILDEIDSVTSNFFDAFRGELEAFQANTRFIGTCNYISKIPDPILSRFSVIDFNFTGEEETELKKIFFKRIYEICQFEKIQIEKEAIKELVLKLFPDFRNILNTLQNLKLSDLDIIKKDDIKSINSGNEEFYEFILEHNNPMETYKYVVSNFPNKTDDAFQMLGFGFLEFLSKDSNLIKHIPKITSIISRYQEQRNFVIDPLLSLLACIYEIKENLN